MSVSSKHWEETWNGNDVRSVSEEHVMATWGPAGPTRRNPLLVRGEGVYVYDDAGKQYFDWTSQAVCANLGHTIPDSVAQALNKQLQSLPYAYSGFGITEMR